VSCTVNPVGGGVVTYTVRFAGGSGWRPAANYHDGVYRLDIAAGHGPPAGLDAVINGAPVQDVVDGSAQYVLFPGGHILQARC
jgi:hypothetical protein